ncbi:thioredoxin F-type, chloroplastic-like isoform X2 [Quercus lobata]|uniref:thioredoxin F-type, chloroplastic-like isoform X2 n=1 Tax=Quercus lobata TaxID=97700 RepID=UPI001247E7F9|nr:thioredoxin F-type, chloroplastic-like isoform X2 [Quercus lobata]
MALNLSLSAPPIRSPQQPLLHYSAKHTIVVSSDRLSYPKSTVSRSRSRSRRVVTRVRSSLDIVGPTVKVGQVTEVDKDTFWPLVKAADDKTVVLDMYTQWCGPCKVMAPKFQELSQKYLDVVFLKLDCNQENKPLAKELGIKVVPTFKILKDSKVVKEVTGAKFDDLVLAIDAVRSS